MAFGTIALTRLWLRDSCLEISGSHTHGSMRVLAQRQSAAGRGPASVQPAGFDIAGIFASAPIDRRTARRGRGTAVDEQFLTLDMRGIIGGEEQHRL